MHWLFIFCHYRNSKFIGYQKHAFFYNCFLEVRQRSTRKLFPPENVFWWSSERRIFSPLLIWHLYFLCSSAAFVSWRDLQSSLSTCHFPTMLSPVTDTERKIRIYGNPIAFVQTLYTYQLFFVYIYKYLIMSYVVIIY